MKVLLQRAQVNGLSGEVPVAAVVLDQSMLLNRDAGTVSDVRRSFSSGTDGDRCFWSP